MQQHTKKTIRLSNQTLDALPARVIRPSYDRDKITTGIVHMGPGAFHRGHQAAYTDDALVLDPRWGVCAVSLRSADVKGKLAEQDNLYTLVMLGKEPSYRIIGSIQEILVAPESPEEVLKRLVDTNVYVVTLTITEKGYCLTANGSLDKGREEVIHDLEHPSQPRSAIGFIVEGLRQRRSHGIPPFAVLSCDNLSQNGRRLQQVVVEFAEILDKELADWIGRQVAFPCSMVDSITPAITEKVHHRVTLDLGVRDAWPVQREPFSQWVIEDCFSGPRPPWNQVGVTFAKDVRPFEEAKLRLLNGTHSALAYLGILAGETTVDTAMQMPEFSNYLSRMMKDEICPGLCAARGLRFDEYCEAILARYRNPNVQYLLSQIAEDGSQKIPIRVLSTIESNLCAGRSVYLLSLVVAAWMKFVQLAVKAGLPHADPLRDEIFSIAAACSGDDVEDVDGFLSLSRMFPPSLASLDRFKTSMRIAYKALGDATRNDVLAAITETGGA